MIFRILQKSTTVSRSYTTSMSAHLLKNLRLPSSLAESLLEIPTKRIHRDHNSEQLSRFPMDIWKEILELLDISTLQQPICKEWRKIAKPIILNLLTSRDIEAILNESLILTPKKVEELFPVGYSVIKPLKLIIRNIPVDLSILTIDVDKSGFFAITLNTIINADIIRNPSPNSSSGHFVALKIVVCAAKINSGTGSVKIKRFSSIQDIYNRDHLLKPTKIIKEQIIKVAKNYCDQEEIISTSSWIDSKDFFPLLLSEYKCDIIKSLY